MCFMNDEITLQCRHPIDQLGWRVTQVTGMEMFGLIQRDHQHSQPKECQDEIPCVI